MTEDFTIDKVSWHTKVVGSLETREEIFLQFGVLHKYLQQHDLLRPDLPDQHQDIDENFEIHTRDLTEEGLAFMRATEREAEVLCGSGSTDADIAPARRICRQPPGAQP